MASKKSQAVPADQVRRDLIRWFYQQNKSGRAAAGIQDVCAGVKNKFGHLGPLVKEHLTYLVDLGFIRKEVLMIRISTGPTVRDQPKVSYRIAAKGIEFMEGKSQFSDKERYPGINISATGGSSIVLGDGNVVNSSYRSLYEELGRFRQAVADSSELNDSAKLEASVNIETIRDQLALNKPDRTIIEKAWDVVNKICTSATLIDYSIKLAPFIEGLFK